MVVKSERRLYLLRGGEVLKSYRVALGRQPRGTKIYQGDGRTPEGRYVLDGAQCRQQPVLPLPARLLPQCRGPGPGPRRWARRAGGLIMMHGLPTERPDWGEEHWRFNWTNGCIAVDEPGNGRDLGQRELGTPIEIRP